ncbi:MAG: hypothetical protein AAFR93_01395 [Pseudomonadota bacterium]
MNKLEAVKAESGIFFTAAQDFVAEFFFKPFGIEATAVMSNGVMGVVALFVLLILYRSTVRAPKPRYRSRMFDDIHYGR